MKIPIFKVPKDYSDYTFWRSEHQRWAVFVMIAATIFAAVSFFLGCSQASSNVNTSAEPAKTIEQKLTAKQVIDVFKNAKFPITKEVIYSEETDPNKLLNRPNQYIEKVSWLDTRIKDKLQETNATIEVFQNEEDLQNRRKYVESMNKAASALAQYIYTHKNILFRINHQLLPKEAEEYEKILKSL